MEINLEAEDVQKHVSEINSRADFSKAIASIVQSLTSQSPGSFINISNLGTEFQKRYRHTVTSTMRRLNLGSKFPNFLQDCSYLNLKQNGKQYEVALVKD